MIKSEAREIFKQNLQKFMGQLGVDQAYIVAKLGITASTVSDWVNGKKYPRVDAMQRLADLFGVRLSDLTDLPDISLPKGVLPIARKRIPLLGCIAAGQPIFAEEEHEAYVSVDENLQCDFALRVEGKSMEPGLHDGDIVFIRQQEDVDDGRIAAVLVDDSATLKRVTHIKGGLRLIGDNPSVFLPTDYLAKDYDNLRILGLAVAFHRKI